MPNELVRFDDERGQQVSFTADDVRNLFAPTATDKELALFMALCQSQKLNPFVKDAYLVKYGNSPATIITGKDVFVKRAAKSPEFDGMEHGVVFSDRNGTVRHREGAAVYEQIGETLLGGWAKVYRKGWTHAACAELSLSEYSTGKSNWARMPAVMINKCAQVAALRLAFPEDFQGMYAAEEMGVRDEEQLQPEPVRQAPPVDLQPIRDIFPQWTKAIDSTPSDGMHDLCEAVGARSMDRMTHDQVQAALKVMHDDMDRAKAPEPVEVEVEQGVAESQPEEPDVDLSEVDYAF